jgi:tRNA modification GTPase
MQFLSLDEQTIIAQCTPSGSGALALLRLSGKDAWNIAQAMSALPHDKKLLDQPSHTVHYGWVRGTDQQLLDQVMFIVMRGPKTFTGQDTVEITCHNNPFIIEAIIEHALHHGARPAQAGEFARRAFMNKKIDLIQAEAIQELIGAQTQHALKKSMAQLEGSFSQLIAKWEEKLLKIFAWCQASFEFLDEEIEFAQQINNALQKVLEEIASFKKNFNQQQHIRQGIRISLIGSVNAGKSSLFNVLIGHQRAIVTDQAGTTRDTIEAGVYRKGAYWTFIDTAGIRTSHDIIEQEGIKRSYEEAHKADIIILVFDISRPLKTHEEHVYQQLYATFSHKIIVVYNKSDLGSFILPSFNFSLSPVQFSTITKSGHAELEKRIEDKAISLFETENSPFLLTKRHLSLLNGLEEKLLTINKLLSDTLHYEIIAYHLQDALEHISQLTGKTISEAAMDAVFKEFCVGK